MIRHLSISSTGHRPTRATRAWGRAPLALLLLCCASAMCSASEGQAGFSGAAQVRGEHWNNFLFAPAADDTFGVARVLLGYRAEATPTWAVFGQVKLANATSRDLPGGRRTLDVDTVDLQQGYVEWRPGAVPLRAQRRLTAAAHRFRRATTGDAVYNAGGGVVRQAADSGSRDIGSEIDLTLTAPVAKGTLLLGLSRFFRGAALRQPGGENSTFGYVQWAATF